MAALLGWVNLDAMLRSITAKQFRGWEHMFEIDPFGELRADYRTAQILAMLFNVNRGKDQKAAKPEDHLLTFSDKKSNVPQTIEEQIAIAKIMAMAAAAGAKDLD